MLGKDLVEINNCFGVRHVHRVVFDSFVKLIAELVVKTFKRGVDLTDFRFVRIGFVRKELGKQVFGLCFLA